ncbi:hypothetical protein L2E82_10654 [Cichorium intybus]|uniref:Uncharacterized protein n=1 Tax=Cichorium intybus TaxID=13427 RepID=A0ACB9GB01_CICIN|nr:hypothetical protein L2E82_10654 [Cichorium intybus]
MPIFPPSFTPQESCVGLTMTTNVSTVSTATRVATSATITVSATHLALVCLVPANHLQADVVWSSRPVQAISPVIQSKTMSKRLNAFPKKNRECTVGNKVYIDERNGFSIIEKISTTIDEGKTLGYSMKDPIVQVELKVVVK